LGVENNKRIPVPVLAGALAAKLVVFLIPLLVLLVTITGTYAGAIGADPVEVAQTSGMTGLLADAVRDTSEASDGFKTTSILVMFFATLWAADSLGRLARRTHALVWNVDLQRVSRRWVLPLSVLGISIVGMILAGSRSQVRDWPAALALAELLFEMVTVAAFWLVLSLFLPRSEDAGSWRSVLPGAILVGLGVIAMKAATIFYFAPKSVSLGVRYGDLAFAVLLLTWAYWLAIMAVSAAELNVAVLRSRRRPLD
jgi:membrane protein